MKLPAGSVCARDAQCLNNVCLGGHCCIGNYYSCQQQSCTRGRACVNSLCTCYGCCGNRDDCIQDRVPGCTACAAATGVCASCESPYALIADKCYKGEDNCALHYRPPNLEPFAFCGTAVGLDGSAVGQLELSYTDSEAFCAAIYNRHLVTVNDATENKWLVATLNANNYYAGPGFLIGYDNGQWSSGYTSAYTNWAGSSSKYASLIHYREQWETVNDNALSFICELGQEPGPNQTIPLACDSSPCANGGTCSPAPFNMFQCSCPLISTL